MTNAKRSPFFLIVVGLFGLGLGLIVNILDPLIYTEKVRQLAPPALKNTTLSFITIMALLVALVAQPLIGHWSDHTRSRWGKRAPFLIGGVIGLSFSLPAIALAGDLWLLIIAAMLTSAFANTVQSVWQALIPDQVPKKQHGAAAGVKTLMELLGAVAGVALAGVGLAQGNLWAAPLIAAGLFWLILPTTLYTLWRVGIPERLHPQDEASNAVSTTQPQETPANAGKLGRRFASAPSSPAGADISANIESRPLIKRSRFLNETGSVTLKRLALLLNQTPAFFWWIINRLLFWSAGIAVRTFILNYMEDVLLLPLSEVQSLSGRLLLFLGVGVMLLVLPAGALADRIGRRPLLIAAGLLASGGSILLIFIREPDLLFVAAGLIACGAGFFASTSWALAADLTPRSKGALYLGIANGATVIGSISGRLGGPMIDALNQTTPTGHIGYFVVFSIAGLFFAGSSLVVLKIPALMDSKQ